MLNTLLLSQDARLIETLQSACTSVGLSLTACSKAAEVAFMLARCKFYGVMIDSADPELTMQVLSTVRESSSSRKAISIVVSDTSVAPACSTFVLEKPLAVDLAMRTLRAAKGPMLNEFRGYFRQPMQRPVLITKDSGGELKATSINVSPRGLAVRMAGIDVIARSDAVRARLTLRGAQIEIKGKVAWTDIQGRAGIHCVLPRDQQQLEKLLAPGFPQK